MIQSFISDILNQFQRSKSRRRANGSVDLVMAMRYLLWCIAAYPKTTKQAAVLFFSSHSRSMVQYCIVLHCTVSDEQKVGQSLWQRDRRITLCLRQCRPVCQTFCFDNNPMSSTIRAIVKQWKYKECDKGPRCESHSSFTRAIIIESSAIGDPVASLFVCAAAWPELIPVGNLVSTYNLQVTTHPTSTAPEQWASLTWVLKTHLIEKNTQIFGNCKTISKMKVLKSGAVSFKS